MALMTAEEHEEFLAWVREEFGTQVALAYEQRARPKVGHEDFSPHVLLDEVRRKFEDSETRNAKRLGGLMTWRFNS